MTSLSLLLIGLLPVAPAPVVPGCWLVDSVWEYELGTGRYRLHLDRDGGFCEEQLHSPGVRTKGKWKYSGNTLKLYHTNDDLVETFRLRGKSSKKTLEGTLQTFQNSGWRQPVILKRIR